MPKVLVVYYSRTGNTEEMAKVITAAKGEEGIEVECKRVEDADPDELLDMDGVVIGSPTYYGTMAAEMKKFLDDSVKHHGKLDGKVGAAFSSAAITGHETTVISILEALLIHGMVVQGDPRGCHYGATALGEPDGSEIQRCQRFGQRVASLVKLVSS